MVRGVRKNADKNGGASKQLCKKDCTPWVDVCEFHVNVVYGRSFLPYFLYVDVNVKLCKKL